MPASPELHERRLMAAELLLAESAAENQSVESQRQEDAAAEQQQPEDGGAADPATTNNNTAPDAAADGVVRGDGCALDLERFCKREANILTLLENAPTGLDAAQVSRAMKGVQLCMAKNVESLSPVCIEALVAELVKQKSSDAHTADALQPATYQSVPDNNDIEDSSVEVSIHYSKHHNTAGGLRGGHAAVAAAAPPAIEQAKLPSPPSGDMDIASPLMWLLVFPFFCIGLYVTYNHALVYLRRRKDALRIESKQYMPVP